MSVICSNCGYERPVHVVIIGDVCPVCTAPYENELLQSLPEPKPSRGVPNKIIIIVLLLVALSASVLWSTFTGPTTTVEPNSTGDIAVWRYERVAMSADISLFVAKGKYYLRYNFDEGGEIIQQVELRGDSRGVYIDVIEERGMDMYLIINSVNNLDFWSIAGKYYTAERETIDKPILTELIQKMASSPPQSTPLGSADRSSVQNLWERVNFNRSDPLCKEAAAHKWMLDFTVHNVPINYEQTIDATQSIITIADAVRVHCGNNKVNFNIQASAKRSIIPSWIEQEVKNLKKHQEKEALFNGEKTSASHNKMAENKDSEADGTHVSHPMLASDNVIPLVIKLMPTKYEADDNLYIEGKSNLPQHTKINIEFLPYDSDYKGREKGIRVDSDGGFISKGFKKRDKPLAGYFQIWLTVDFSKSEQGDALSRKLLSYEHSEFIHDNKLGIKYAFRL